MPSELGVGALSTTRIPPLAMLKFRLLSEGIVITDDAASYINDYNGDRPMTPADYASTSGIILCLDEIEWVNTPIQQYNPNFVADPALRLAVVDGRLAVTGPDLEVPATFWLPPAYHDTVNEQGEAFNSYAFTHGDRVRISPIEGCAMACQFCNLPYEFAYRQKRIEGLVESVRVALDDPIQPAGHVLISGGTPKAEDFGYVRDCYEAVITSFPDVPVDIMMVPSDGLLDLEELHRWGVNELSINIEIFDWTLARRIMRRKADLSQQRYLDFIAEATTVLGPRKVRSMLLVGVESLDSTLAGVAAIADAGGVPVLSPFRPDPATPMEKRPVPTSGEMGTAYARGMEVAVEHGEPLGPSCAPCSHNTMTLADPAAGTARTFHRQPRMI